MAMPSTNMPYPGEARRSRNSWRSPVEDDQHGTLIVDGHGRIGGCGPVAEDLFGAGQSRLTGRLISSLIPGVAIDGDSPDCNASHLLSMCVHGEWRQFDAMDVLGRGFAVEIRMSGRIAEGLNAFVIDFRCPDPAVPGR